MRWQRERTMPVLPFSKQNIVNFFESRDYQYYELHFKDNDSHKNDGDFLIEFSYDSELRCDHSFRLSCQNGVIFLMRGYTNIRFAPEKKPALLASLNTFLIEHAWPKTFVVGEEALQVMTEVNFDFTPGVTQELFDDMVGDQLRASYDVWRWLAKHEI